MRNQTSVENELLLFVENYISEHGDAVWTSSLLDPHIPQTGLSLFSAWGIVRDDYGRLDRIEIVNDIYPAMHQLHFSDEMLGDCPVFVATLLAPHKHYRTETVLRRMFYHYGYGMLNAPVFFPLPYRGNLMSLTVF